MVERGGGRPDGDAGREKDHPRCTHVTVEQREDDQGDDDEPDVRDPLIGIPMDEPVQAPGQVAPEDQLPGHRRDSSRRTGTQDADELGSRDEAGQTGGEPADDQGKMISSDVRHGLERPLLARDG